MIDFNLVKEGDKIMISSCKKEKEKENCNVVKKNVKDLKILNHLGRVLDSEEESIWVSSMEHWDYEIRQDKCLRFMMFCSSAGCEIYTVWFYGFTLYYRLVELDDEFENGINILDTIKQYSSASKWNLKTKYSSNILMYHYCTSDEVILVNFNNDVKIEYERPLYVDRRITQTINWEICSSPKFRKTFVNDIRETDLSPERLQALRDMDKLMSNNEVTRITTLNKFELSVDIIEIKINVYKTMTVKDIERLSCYYRFLPDSITKKTLLSTREVYDAAMINIKMEGSYKVTEKKIQEHLWKLNYIVVNREETAAEPGSYHIIADKMCALSRIITLFCGSIYEVSISKSYQKYKKFDIDFFVSLE